MGTTASGIWYPDGNFTANPRVIAAQQAANLESVIKNERIRYGSVEYATTAARDTALPNPQQGDECSVNGSPMIYISGSGWQLIKTAKNMNTTHAELMMSGSANSSTHVQTFTPFTITAQPFPRLFSCIVHASCDNAWAPTTVYPQFMLYVDGAMPVYVRQLNNMHVVNYKYTALFDAGSTHTIEVHLNMTGTATTAATVSVDGRRAKFIYDLIAA